MASVLRCSHLNRALVGDMCSLDSIKEILLSLGGATAVLGLLSSFLAKLISTRVAQEQNAVILSELENLKHKLSTAQTSYGQQIEHIVSYYDVYYKHYRRCQDVAGQDVISHPENGVFDTKEAYEKELDKFAEEWGELEPRIRLVLPEDAFLLHIESIHAFNDFTQILKSLPSNFSEFKGPLKEQFVVVDQVKEKLERSLRHYLRTDVLQSN
ncbi:hypothetical protein LCA30_21675 [Vibrio harveyi]|uniref:hypothetical protein n=1 Tax=Vibrio harveyi TaxID=669 RepID=UPI003BB6B6AF